MRLEYNGEPLESESTEYLTWELPVSKEFADDWQEVSRAVNCSFFLVSMAFQPEVLTPEEQETGWRVIAHDDHDHKVAVGWRREEQNRKEEERRQAEMAACPYVACTCGHHEDYY